MIPSLLLLLCLFIVAVLPLPAALGLALEAWSAEESDIGDVYAGAALILFVASGAAWWGLWEVAGQAIR